MNAEQNAFTSEWDAHEGGCGVDDCRCYTSRRGVMHDGSLRYCREATEEGDSVPECMGRAVNFCDGCTCPKWSRREREEAKALRFGGSSVHDLHSAVRHALEAHFDALVGFHRNRTSMPFPAWEKGYERVAELIDRSSHEERIAILSRAPAPRNEDRVTRMESM